MSLSQLIHEHAKTLALRTDRFAVKVTRKPDGDRKSYEVDCLVIWTSPLSRASSGETSFRERGEIVAAPDDYATTDRWTLEDRVYAVDAVMPVVDGLQSIHITRLAVTDRTKGLGTL